MDNAFPLLHSTSTTTGSRTTTFTTEEFNLGSIEQDWNATTGLFEDFIFVHNNTAVAWVQGNTVAKEVGATTTDYECELTPVSTHPDAVVGVVLGAVAAAAYAWVARKGSRVEVLAGAAGITADTNLIPSGVAAGVTVDCAAVTNASFGRSSETVLGAALATCSVDCKG